MQCQTRLSAEQRRPAVEPAALRKKNLNFCRIQQRSDTSRWLQASECPLEAVLVQKVRSYAYVSLRGFSCGAGTSILQLAPKRKLQNSRYSPARVTLFREAGRGDSCAFFRALA